MIMKQEHLFLFIYYYYNFFCFANVMYVRFQNRVLCRSRIKAQKTKSLKCEQLQGWEQCFLYKNTLFCNNKLTSCFIGVRFPRSTSVDGSPLPSPRFISNSIMKNSSSPILDHRLTIMHMAWGQFLDHDFVLTPVSQGNISNFCSNS